MKKGWQLTPYTPAAPTLIQLAQPSSLADVRTAALLFADSMRISDGNSFGGYRYSAWSQKPVLYATIATLLLKHLLNAVDERCVDELRYLVGFQSEDGLFRDPVISCPESETQDWWGSRHLTLLALMTLGLFKVPAKYGLQCVKPLYAPNSFRKHLDAYDWGTGAADTSNAIQNTGVMMQYARDFQGEADADKALQFLFDYLDERQDETSGLFGHSFASPQDLSHGVQAGYHFWLLYFYDKRPIRHLERIIDSILASQSLSGGFGVKWNSSACEDIDSIDPLARLCHSTTYRHSDVRNALERARPAVIKNLNHDGGWVFRRDEAFTYGYSAHMHSATNQSNLFFTWFRLLSLSFTAEGLGDSESKQQLQIRWGNAPGLQFFP